MASNNAQEQARKAIIGYYTEILKENPSLEKKQAMRQAIEIFKTKGLGDDPEYEEAIRDLDLAKLLADGEQARRIKEVEDAKLESEKLRQASLEKANLSIDFEQKRRVKTQELNDQAEQKKQTRRRKNSMDAAIDATEKERSRQLDDLEKTREKEKRLRRDSIDDVTALTEIERARQMKEHEANKKIEARIRKQSMDEASQVTEDERSRRVAAPGKYQGSNPSNERVTSSEMIKAQVLRCYTQLRIGCQNFNCCSAHCASNPINAFRLLTKKDAMFQAIMLIKMQDVQLCPETRRSAASLNSTSKYYEEIIRNPDLARLLGNEEQKRRIQESESYTKRDIEERRRRTRHAALKEDYEKARRIKENEYYAQNEKKDRILSQFKADRAVDTERRRRMSHDESAQNEETQRRKESIDLAVDLQEKERARQIREEQAKKAGESVDSENRRRKNSIDLATNSVDDEQERLERVRKTQEILASEKSVQDRMKNKKKAKHDADAEQGRRVKELEVQIAKEKKDRKNNQIKASNAADLEQQRRISEDQEVQKEERRQRKKSVDLVISLQEEERLRRIAEDAGHTIDDSRQDTINSIKAATEEERARLIKEHEKRKAEEEKRKAELERLQQIEKEREVVMSFEPKRFGLLFQDNMIEDVEQGTQAAKLGVNIGFKIISINGVDDLDDAESILEAIGKTYCANKKTAITFRREKLHKIQFEPGQFGMQFQGNRVKKVCSCTQADAKGVQVGSVILSVNGKMQPSNTYTILEAIETSNNANQPTTVTFCLP